MATGFAWMRASALMKRQVVGVEPARENMADTTSDEVASSPFDVDLGGEQRRELRSQLRMANIQLANARDDRALMQAQIEALQRLERESKARAMISGHRRQSVAAAYGGWARSVALSLHCTTLPSHLSAPAHAGRRTSPQAFTVTEKC